MIDVENTFGSAKLRQVVCAVFTAAVMLTAGCSSAPPASETTAAPTTSAADRTTAATTTAAADRTTAATTTAAQTSAAAITQAEAVSTMPYPDLMPGQASVIIRNKSTGTILPTVYNAPSFTSQDSADAMGVTVGFEDGAEYLSIMALTASGIAKKGAHLTGSDIANDNALIMIYYINGYASDGGVQILTSATNGSEVNNGTFDIAEYTNKSNARFYIGTDFTLGGVTYTAECYGNAEYTLSQEDIDKQNKKQYDDDVANGRCTVCHGSGTCQVCYGRGRLSYNTWGQGGSGYVDCEGCKGSGKCSYCGGTGKG